MTKRIKVTQKQLSSAIAVWLKSLPKKVWEDLAEYKLLSLYKRQGPQPLVDHIIAEHIATEMTSRDWEVTHPPMKHLGSPPPHGGMQ